MIVATVYPSPNPVGGLEAHSRQLAVELQSEQQRGQQSVKCEQHWRGWPGNRSGNNKPLKW
eukprot:1898745-Amphidinium_carterae.1